jgi:hypothetical protein
MAGGQRQIDQMYAFTQVDPLDNTEGVIAFLAESGWIPMVGADMDRIEYLRPMAQRVANETRTPVKLLRFSFRQVMEELIPDG